MWYVMQVMSGEEHRIVQQCRRQMGAGYYSDIFIPRYVTKKRYQGQWHERKEILFPGYLFIDTEDIEPFLTKLPAISGMTKLLRNADEIAPITAEEKKYLTDMMDDDHVVRISVGYLIGDRICITQGALRNYTGRISKIDRHRRTAELLVDLFGRKTKVQVGLEVVKKVTEQEFAAMKDESMGQHAPPAGPDDAREGPSRVKVVSGVFAGMLGSVIESYPQKSEVKVSIRLFGEDANVVFREEELSYCL